MTRESWSGVMEFIIYVTFWVFSASPDIEDFSLIGDVKNDQRCTLPDVTIDNKY